MWLLCYTANLQGRFMPWCDVRQCYMVTFTSSQVTCGMHVWVHYLQRLTVVLKILQELIKLLGM